MNKLEQKFNLIRKMIEKSWRKYVPKYFIQIKTMNKSKLDFCLNYVIVYAIKLRNWLML